MALALGLGHEAAAVLAVAPASGWMLDATGAQPASLWQWTGAFASTFLLLPATAAMGATLGVLATAFWLLPVCSSA